MRDYSFDRSRYAALAASRIDFRRSVITRPEPIDFVMPGFALGSFGTCISQGGVGKSMFWLQKCVSVTLGRDLFNLWSSKEQSIDIKAGPVVMISAEDPSVVLQNRIYEIGKHLEPEQTNIVNDELLLLSTQGLGFNAADRLQNSWLASLKEVISDWGKCPRLMVFDTLNRCLGDANENSASDIGAIVSNFESLCTEFGCATIVLHHANRSAVKADAVHSLLSARGSSALVDNSRYVETLSSESRDNVCVSFPKTSYSKQPPSVCLHRDTDGVLWGVHLSPSPKEQDPERLLLEFLPDGEDPLDGSNAVDEGDWT
ncbi:MAG: helicase RepA family protein [Rhodobacteraceae bacterium]|nr:helicase RepA family protein [Paracoccaceae bacterium]